MDCADDQGTFADWIRLDQRACWRIGKGKRVEEYLAEHPRLQSDHPLTLDLIYEEFCLRRECGEAVDPAEYLDRFAALATELERLFELHDVLADVPVTDPSPRPPTIRISPTHATISLQRSPPAAVPSVDVALPAEVQGNDVPSRIGRYDVKEKLGSGTFGKVYRAFDSQLGRDVAIKVPRQQCFESPEQFDSYLSEARTLAALDHPHIVPIYDVGATKEHPCYIVSKLVDGTNLGRRMQSETLGVATSVSIVAAIADALHHAHLKGLVHRDVKPANILLDANDCPVLADFGLALHDGDLGKHPGMMGTLAYMSPEQARGEAHRVDGRSDIFSLGVVLYELLTGKRPFRADDPSELRDQITTMDARPLRQIDGSIPRELERICLKCLAKRPADRYATAADLADELRRVLTTAEAMSDGAALRGWLPVGLQRFAPHLAVAMSIAGVLLLTSLAWSLRRPSGVPAPLPEAATENSAVQIRQFDAQVHRPTPDGLSFVGLLRDDDPDVLPLQENDEVRIQLELTRPAYVYLVWIDTAGKPIPVYPWQSLDDWDSLVEREPARVVEVPPLTMGVNEPGMETIVALVRSGPLPMDFDFESKFAELPQAERSNRDSLVYFENGAAVAQQSTVYRGPSRFSQRPSDGLRELQEALYRRLSTDFQLVASISFPCYDEAANAIGHRSRPSRPVLQLEAPARHNPWGLDLKGQPLALPLVKQGKDAMRQADFLHASAVFQQALEGLDPADESYRRVRAFLLSEIGHAKCKLGDYLAARQMFEEALRLVANDREGLSVLFHATNGLTALLKDQGEYHAAIEQCEAAIRLIQTHSPESVVQRAILLGNLGVLLSEQGILERMPAALHCAEESLEIMKAHEAQSGDRRYVHVALNNLGYVLSKIGDHQRALVSYEESLKLRRELLQPNHSLIARSLEKVADELVAQKRFEEAEAHYRAAMKINDEAYGDLPNGHLHAVSNTHGLGRVLAARGKLQEAREVLERAEEIERRFALDFVSGASEAESLNYLAYRLGPADELMSLYLMLDDVPGYEQYAHIAARKAITYRRLAVRNRPAFSLSPEQQAAVEEYSQVIKQLAALSVAPQDVTGELKRAMSALGARKESLERQLADRQSSPPDEDIDVDSIQHQLASLAPDTVILDFLRFDRHDLNALGKSSPEYAVYVLSAEGVRVITLPNADRIDELIWTWRDELLSDRSASGGRLPARRSRGELFERLWTPLASAMPKSTRNVWVCPDGAIAALPWGGLGGRDDRCLIDDYCFAVVPHALSVTASAEPLAVRPRHMLLVGDVVNDQQPFLAAAGEELQAVEALAREGECDVETLTGEMATEPNVIAAAATADWIHLAVHGAFLGETLLQESLSDLTRGREAHGERNTVLARNPLTLSGLYLSGTPSNTQGFMSAQLIATQDLGRLQCVVLSACETGIGDSARGEGVFGLQRAFHLAGSRAVLASLWKVEDESTRDFMVELYRMILREDASVVEALNATQRLMWRRGERESRWAAFNVSLAITPAR